jgi:hypothetical protein
MPLQTYLDVVLGVASREAQSTGTSTTKNAEGSVIPLNVNEWDSILNDLPHQNAVQTARSDRLRRRLPDDIDVTSEGGIQREVEVATSFVAISCSGHGATMSAQGVRGSPDIRIFDNTTGQTKIVGEVKTFWAFPVNDLVTLWRDGTRSVRRGLIQTTFHKHLERHPPDHSCDWCRANRLQRKAFDAIRQINQV